MGTLPECYIPELGEQKQGKVRSIYFSGQNVVMVTNDRVSALDDKGVLHVIDEVNTPDSSRLCTVGEWEAKYPKIAAEMASGKYKDVTAVLKAKPELKMKEFSKQYVRDALLEMGFDPTKDKAAPKLSDEQVVECAYRYIRIYEQITGKSFEFPAKMQPSKRIIMNLQRAGMLVGGFAVIAAGSDSDMPHLQNIQKELSKFKIPSQIRICSAHKQPARLEALLGEYNKSTEPVLLVGCAGGTDALSGTASYFAKFPVVSCPPDGQNPTCLTNPPGSSNAFICKPANVAKFAAQYFANHCPQVAEALETSIAEKIRKLEQADEQLLKKARTA